MNLQQVRLYNTQHILTQQCGGSRVNPNNFKLGESLRLIDDVDLQVDEGIVSVPKGTYATVEQNDSQQLLLNLGEGLGKFVLDIPTVSKYFERGATKKVESIQEAMGNPVIATPGAYVQITSYDPNIGPNRGPKSPGHGGYQTLVGQKGQIATIFGQINGIKTYKVQLVQGGEFVFGETEFQVIRGTGTQESIEAPKGPQVDLVALRSLGYSL